MTTTPFPTTETKICTKCKIEKPLTEFYTRKGNTGVLAPKSSCKPCMNAYRRGWFQENRDEILAKNRVRSNSPEGRAKARKNYRSWDQERKDGRNKTAASLRQSNRRLLSEQYRAKHGSVPLCGCGCGQEVNMRIEDEPYRYLKGHTMRDPAIAQRVSVTRRLTWDAQAVRRGMLDAHKFAAILVTYKTKHKFTWAQVAERAGISVEQMYSLRDLKNRKYVTRNTADSVLRRLSGQAARPTTHQSKLMRRDEVRKVITQGGLHGVMVVKNEEARYLQACLDWHRGFLDEIVILDDSSSDDTFEICRSYTPHVIRRPDEIPSFTVNESQLRQFVWDSAAKILSLSKLDWLCMLDADEFLVSETSETRLAVDRLRERAMFNDQWALKVPIPEVFVYENDEAFIRTDGFWRNANTRIVRWRDGVRFRDRVMGGGSVPMWYDDRKFTGDGVSILHFGYADKHDRTAKHRRYTSMANHGHNPRHIASIITPPRLEKWQGQTPKVWRGLT